jgi:hypothetical protein
VQSSARRNLRNEKASLTTLITKLPTNPLAQSESTASVFNRRLRAGPLHRPSMASNKVGKDRSMTTQAQRHHAIAQSETATFANGWLTKMIKGPVALKAIGP